MAIVYLAEGVKRPKLKYKIISRWIKLVLNKYDTTVGSITYVFCDDEYLKGVNQQFLNHDYFTDIVTFDYRNGSVISGDLVISIDRVAENAAQFGCDVNDEFLRVMIHGLLHILGYKDHDSISSSVMREKEEESVLMYKNICNECIE